MHKESFFTVIDVTMLVVMFNDDKRFKIFEMFGNYVILPI